MTHGRIQWYYVIDEARRIVTDYHESGTESDAEATVLPFGGRRLDTEHQAKVHVPQQVDRETSAQQELP